MKFKTFWFCPKAGHTPIFGHVWLCFMVIKGDAYSLEKGGAPYSDHPLTVGLHKAVAEVSKTGNL